MRILVLSFFIVVSPTIFSQTIQIGVFNSKEVNSYTLSVQKGKYFLECDGQKLAEYKKNSIFFVNRILDRVEVRDKNSQIGVFKEVKFISKDKDGILLLRGVNPSTKSREYNDAIIFRTNDSRLQALNLIDLEKYIAAVIEAEGGANAPLEYYKAQGVLVRTYTIKSIYKHAEEGFNLCDEVHCQAYHGRSTRNPAIYRATRSTSGEVLIGVDSVLAMTPFHSSCGGQTSSAGIYWQSDLPYLQSVSDPFCLERRNATWEKRIALKEWKSFLTNNGVSDTEDYLSYTQTNRQKYFSEKHNLTLRSIRQTFGLKSTYFVFEPEKDEIVFKGKGFGHGIGMCQLGAMEMARVGFTYLDILHFYFQQVTITDYREMDLSRY